MLELEGPRASTFPSLFLGGWLGQGRVKEAADGPGLAALAAFLIDSYTNASVSAFSTTPCQREWLFSSLHSLLTVPWDSEQASSNPDRIWSHGGSGNTEKVLSSHGV